MQSYILRYNRLKTQNLNCPGFAAKAEGEEKHADILSITTDLKYRILNSPGFSTMEGFCVSSTPARCCVLV